MRSASMRAAVYSSAAAFCRSSHVAILRGATSMPRPRRRQMRSSLRTPMSVVPLSINEMVLRSRPDASASCCCVMRSAFRAWRTAWPISGRFFCWAYSTNLGIWQAGTSNLLNKTHVFRFLTRQSRNQGISHKKAQKAQKTKSFFVSFAPLCGPKNFSSFRGQGASQFLKGVNCRPYRRLPSLLVETITRPKASRLGSLRYFCLPLLNGSILKTHEPRLETPLRQRHRYCARKITLPACLMKSFIG